MRAIRYNASIPRYVLAQAIGRISLPLLWGGLSSTSLEDVPPPPLPADDWLLIRTRYGGICGSDMGMVLSLASAYYEPLISMPLTLGHENVGSVADVGPAVRNVQVGDRVVVEPLLWCRPRGFDNLCTYCAKGEINRCERFTDGQISASMYTGTCSQTRSSWSQFFVAHESQIYHLPDEISDENALLVEPFACCIHAVLADLPSDDQKILIIGSGTIGLLTLAALRIFGCQAEITILAKYAFQAKSAIRLGADSVITGGDPYAQVAAQYNARLFKPRIGRRIIRGGPDITYDCVGTDRSIDSALRMTNSGGRVVLLGLPGIARGIDWSSLFSQELVVNGSFLYHRAEEYKGKKISSFALAIELFANQSIDLSWLITHRLALLNYKQAFRQITQKSENKTIKAIFEFNAGF